VAQTGSKIKCLPLQEAPTTQQAPAAQEEASEMPNELPATGGPDLALPSLAGAALLLTGLVSLALASRRRSRS
jgi:LPXTG-motif cell wall-anchored protein